MARVRFTDPATGVTVEAEESHPVASRWRREAPADEPKKPARRSRKKAEQSADDE